MLFLLLRRWWFPQINVNVDVNSAWRSARVNDMKDKEAKSFVMKEVFLGSPLYDHSTRLSKLRSGNITARHSIFLSLPSPSLFSPHLPMLWQEGKWGCLCVCVTKPERVRANTTHILNFMYFIPVFDLSPSDPCCRPYNGDYRTTPKLSFLRLSFKTKKSNVRPVHKNILIVTRAVHGYL